MKKKEWVLVIIILAMSFALISCGRKLPGVKKYPLETFYSVYRTYGASFSPDEKDIAFITNRSGKYNIWTVCTQGIEPKQLTDFDDGVMFVTWCRNENSLIFLQDKGGNENFHLYIMPALGGTPVDLTPGDSVNSYFLGWAHDGYRFLYQTNQRDRRFFDIYIYDLRTRDSKLIYRNDTGLAVSTYDNNLTKLAFNRPYTKVNSDVFLYDIDSKTMTLLTPHEGNINYEAVDFSPEGKELYLLTDKDNEFTYLIKMDLDSFFRQVGTPDGTKGGSQVGAPDRTPQMVEVKKADWDVVWAGFSYNGKYFVTAVNQDGSIKLEVIETATGIPVQLPTLPDGELSHISFSPSEQFMAFYFSGDMVPSDLQIMDMRNRTVTRLTNSVPKELDVHDLVESQLIRYTSFDGKEIPAYLYKPKDTKAGDKLPAIVMIHGGPQLQESKGFGSLRQYIMNQGWVLLIPNVRGSVGYGKTYYSMDDRDWGGAPLKDAVAAKNYLARLGYVDPNKVVIMGGSYGGYMVLAALAFTPEEFAAGVDICGISNLTTFLESIPPYWEPFKKMLMNEVGDPKKDADFLKARSPLFSAEKIVKPLFVIQGANDPMVKQAESDAIVNAIKANNGIVEYMIFPDEGHGLRKQENSLKAFHAIFAFLDKYVK